jgi:hypothetical protein
MAKSFAQSKGARGEREIVNILQPIVDKVYNESGKEPPSLLRNSLQSREGGYDLIGLDWMALEVKRCETLSIPAWTRQCIEQARAGQTPILIYKQNNRAWKVMMHGLLVPGGSTNLKVWMEISVESFLSYFEYRLKHEVTK